MNPKSWNNLYENVMTLHIMPLPWLIIIYSHMHVYSDLSFEYILNECPFLTVKWNPLVLSIYKIEIDS